MTTEQQTTEGAPGAPAKPKIQVIEETVLAMIDTMEDISKRLAGLEKTSVKKSTQRLGAKHERTAVKDTKTNIVYPSKFAAGKALAAEFGLDPLNNFAYYQIIKAAPDRLAEATDDETAAAHAKADAELQAQVDESNKKLAAEEAAKAAAEAKAAAAKK